MSPKLPTPEPVDTKPKLCECDGQIVEQVEGLGVMCSKCGRKKAAK